MIVQAYLNFEGRCDEALKFYEKAIGARIGMVMRFKDNPSPEHNPPGSENKVMHSEFTIGDTQLFATDGFGKGSKFEGISLSIATADDKETEKVFKALAESGEVTMPLGKTFFASSFGMLKDRFGVQWMVITNKN